VGAPSLQVYDESDVAVYGDADVVAGEAAGQVLGAFGTLRGVARRSGGMQPRRAASA